MKPIKLASTRLLPIIAFILVCLPVYAAADAQATLAWDANDTPPKGYRLYWRTEGQSYKFYQYFDTGRSTSETIYGLDENTTYYFVVRAHDGIETSDKSNEVAFNTDGVTSVTDRNPPLQPYTISPEEEALEVALQPTLQCAGFDDPDSTDHHIQTRWQIYRLLDDELVMDIISSDDLTQLDVPHGALEGDTSYYWTVIHINQLGASSPPAPDSYFTTGLEIAGSTGSSTLGSGSDGNGGDTANTGCFVQTIQP